MVKVNLLNSILKIKRNVNQRIKKTKDDIKISKKFGKDYFDGKREYGYGGYKYDGRWVTIAEEIVSRYNLKMPNIYNWVSENSHLYDYILTNEKTLLDKGEKFIFFPSGGSWVEEKNRKFHDKTKIVSIICSHKKMVPDHYKRHELISQFGHVIDVMGRGYKKIQSISDGLKDYAFHIAMENERRDLHFSEKIINPMLTGTIPIYWGMPSIGNYFDTRGMIIMNDINEFSDIYNSLGEELYKDMLPYAKENFKIAQEYISIEDWVYNTGVFAKMGITHD